MSNNQQTNNEIHGDQLLNSLVNPPDEEVTLSLTENAEFDTENTYEIPVDTCADGAPVSTLCERSEDIPHENSIFYHLHTEFDLEALKQVGDTLLQRDALDVLP